MIYSMFILLGILALICVILSLIPKNAWLRTIMSSFAMGLFAYLAISAHHVTKVYVDLGSTIPQHIVHFETHDAIAIANLCWLMFIIAFLMLIVNALMTFADTGIGDIKNIGKREPKWKSKFKDIHGYDPSWWK